MVQNHSLMNLKNWFTVITTILVALLITATAAPRGVQAFDPGGPPPAGGVPTVVTGNWEWINYGPNGGSYSPQNEINADNAQFLTLKWVYPYASLEDDLVTGTGSRTPVIIVDGVAYVTKEDRHIIALDAETGEELWIADGGSQIDSDDIVARYPFVQGWRGHVHALNYYREQNWLMMSTPSCGPLMAFDAANGEMVMSIGIETLCGTPAQYGNPAVAAATPGQGIGSLGNQGLMASISNHPPSIKDDILVWPAMGASGRGGRSSVIGIDISNREDPQVVWRTWLAPPAQGDVNWAIDQCSIVDGNGWFFETPEFYAAGGQGGDYLATNCNDIPRDVLLNDWININPNTPHFGKMHVASSVAPVWGNMPISQTTGYIYLGTGDIGPYPNASYRYGPNLHGSGIVALDVATGDLKWFFASNPHDLWDQDCSWGGMLGNSGGQEVLIKSCKNGIVYALNTATGEPVWVFDPPSIVRTFRDWNWGVDSNGQPTQGVACCRMTVEDMSKPWMNCGSWDFNTMKCTAPEEESNANPIGPDAWAHIESDMAFDGQRIYVAVHNTPREFNIRNVQDFGNQGSTVAYIEGRNTTLWAIDINTGTGVWSHFIDEATYRGGVSTSGGVVYAYAGDGNLYMVNAETGELIEKRIFGVQTMVMPTVGAGSDGKHKLFLHIGGGPRQFAGIVRADRDAGGVPSEGALAVLGLPDVLPEPEIVEVVREVPGPVIEVPGPIVEVPGPERIVEVPVEVEVQVISPISYVAIGLGVVLVVIAGVLFTRRRST